MMYTIAMNIGKPLIILSKIVMLLVVFVFVLLLIVLIGLNLFKFAFYNDYFACLSKEGKIPGLSEGFVPQGITFFDNMFASCGYMTSDDNSRVYVIDLEKDEIKYFPLISNGKGFKGYTGGIQYLNGYMYLANEGNSLYKFTAASLYQKSGTNIEIGNPITVNNNSSFVYGKGSSLYVGEFFKQGDYDCKNLVTYNGETHNAIVSEYDISDLTKPIRVYSIPDLVQGFCVKDNGSIVLSTSSGVNSSYFYEYDSSKIVNTGKTYDEAELFFLTEPSKTIKAPAMSEDLDIVKVSGKERIITLFESASNKYIYGKFFFANYIAGFEFE